MDNNQLIEEEKNEIFERAGAFEETVRTRGWQFIKAYYQNKVQAFATGILLGEKEDISSFENERRELIGIRKLLGFIDSDIENLNRLRKEKKEPKDEE